MGKVSEKSATAYDEHAPHLVSGQGRPTTYDENAPILESGESMQNNKGQPPMMKVLLLPLNSGLVHLAVEGDVQLVLHLQRLSRVGTFLGVCRPMVPFLEF